MALFGDDVIRKYPAVQKFIQQTILVFRFFSVYIPFFEGNRQSRTELASPADIVRRASREGTRDARLRMSAGEARTEHESV